MIDVTIRLGDAQGEILGTLRHPTYFLHNSVLNSVQIGDKTYVIVGGHEGANHETLYVLPMGGQPES